MHLPNQKLFQKFVSLKKRITALKIPVYSAHACYFLILAVLPSLFLLTEVLRTLPVRSDDFVSLLFGFLPDTFAQDMQRLIRQAYRKTSTAVLGLSLLTTLWSASRGIYGILTGLNAIYGAEESRGYFVTRLISSLYMLAFLAVLILTLLLQVFLNGILGLITALSPPFLQILLNILDFRFFLLLFLQVGIFTLMFMFLPNQKNSLGDSLPGALLASCGWLIFSDLFSRYAAYLSNASRIYGTLATLALAMLWLYWCICIVFYGGALNVILKKQR